MEIIYTHITAHRSSREGARIHGLVLHTTEGYDHTNGRPPQDLVELGQVFDGEEASAHLGVDDVGKFARYVPDGEKAWAVCNFNAMTLSLEQVAFAAYSKDEWFKQRHAQLHGAAVFLVYGHVHYGVPLRHGVVSGGAIVHDGVFQHKDLGIVGCGHSDCGDGYPQGYVIDLARYFVAHHLHPTAKHTLALRHELNQVRHHYGIDPIPAPGHPGHPNVVKDVRVPVETG